MKNKKATHIGVILSFVIFTTFIIFMVVVLKPTSGVKNTERATIELLKNNVENFASSEIISIILSRQAAGKCFIFDETGWGLEGLNYAIRNQDNVNIKSERVGKVLYLTEYVDNEIYKLDYSSEPLTHDFSSTPGKCKDLNNFSIRKTENIFETKINELILKQATNYSGLKSDFNMPSEKDFGIIFEFENSTMIGPPLPEQKKSTYVKRFQIIYLDTYANEKSGFFTIYVV